MVLSVVSDAAVYTDEYIEAPYAYASVDVINKADADDGIVRVANVISHLKIRTQRRVPRTGVMLVGLAGNNGTTVVAGILANKKKLAWRTRTGDRKANWFGSLLLSSTLKLGMDSNTGADYYVPLNTMLPMLVPESLVIGGWDINNMKLGDAMRRAQVLDLGVQDQLYEEMQQIIPLPSVYIPNFIAMNQSDRANNILSGSLLQQLEELRQNIREFKQANKLEKVIVLWTGTTERFCSVLCTRRQEGVHDTPGNFLKAIENNHPEIAPSAIYAAVRGIRLSTYALLQAAILEGCSYINGSPQNTLVPALKELAKQHSAFLAGDDFKSGQTKLKSVLVDFLVSAGIKPTSIVSYNHLGNNDGRNLSSPEQFRSKEITKSTVVDDMVASNKILYSKLGEKPDHCVVIKYVPYVGDSKRAMDEYSSEIFMGGLNTIAVHNTCEDSLLAAPIIIDLILLMELCQRITIKNEDVKDSKFENFHHVLSILSYLCKAPLVPQNTPVVNSLASQRACIVNIIRACLGLPPESNMMLEHKVPCMMRM